MDNDLYFEDLEALLNPDQLKQLRDKLKESGKVLVRGVPLIPEVSQAQTQSEWSCRKLAAIKYGKRHNKRRR